MAYRADIEIGVKGVRYLDELQNKLTKVSKSIEDLNRKSVVIRRTIAGQAYAEPAGPGFAPGSRQGALASARAVEQTVARRAQQRIAWEQKVNAVSTGLQKELNSLRVKHNAALYRLEQRRVQRIADQERKAAKETAKKRTERISGVALGAGFPLLFGGGPGAVLGGAAGGLVGGPAGFAAQIALSAVGKQLDVFVEALLKTGKALNDPIESFETLAQQGLFASKAQEKYIKKLIEAGKVNEAAAAIQEEIVKKIGAQGVKDLQAAGAAGDKFNRTMAELGIQVQAAVAGPLTEFLGFVNNLVSSVAAANRQQAELRDFGAALTAADPAAFRQYLKESTALAQKTGGVVDPTAVKQLQQKYITKYSLTPGAVTSEVDQTAAQQVTARTNELRNQVTLSEKQLALTGMTLEEDGRAYVRAAQAVALQEYDNKLLEIKNSQIGKIVDQQQIELQQKNAKLAYDIRLKQIDEEITQNAQVRARAQAQAYTQLSKEIQNTLEFRVREAEFTGGTEAALQKELDLHKDITLQRAYVLSVERSIALEEAERTGTVETVSLLYDRILKNLQDQRNLEEDILRAKRADLQTEKALAAIRAEYEAREPFVQLRRELELQAQYGKTYLRLVTEGMLPAEAERIANFEKLVSDQLYAIDQQVLLTEAAIAEAEARGASTQKIKELREELERINKARGAVIDEAAKGPGQGQTNRQRLETAIADVKGELNTLIDPVNQIVAAADAIGTAFADSFKGIISGAMTAQEALASFFQNIADYFLDMAAQIIAKWIQMTILNAALSLFPGGGGGGGNKGGGFSGDAIAQFNASAAQYRANGGPVSAGSPYVVGEKGPELFVPGKSGTIIPNNKMGMGDANIVVNVDASGSKAEGDAGQANKLGEAIGLAVKQELIKQKRPGGLLA